MSMRVGTTQMNASKSIAANPPTIRVVRRRTGIATSTNRIRAGGANGIHQQGTFRTSEAAPGESLCGDSRHGWSRGHRLQLLQPGQYVFPIILVLFRLDRYGEVGVKLQ